MAVPTEEDEIAAAALIPTAVKLAQEARFLNRGSDKPLPDAITSLLTAASLLIGFSVSEAGKDPEEAIAVAERTIRKMTLTFVDKPRMHS